MPNKKIKMKNLTKTKSGILISFRPHSRKDIPSRIKWWRNPKIREFLTDIRRNNLEQEKKWFDDYFKDKSKIFFTITCNKKPIGMVGLIHIDRKNKHAGIFVVIGEDEFRNKGVGREAINFVVNYGFNKFNLHKIKIAANIKNIAAIKSYLKAGFSKEAILKDEFLRNGKFENETLMYKIRA